MLGILQNGKMVMDPQKAKLFVDEVEFCGQTLGHGQRRPAPGKLMAIERWVVPTIITALRAFLGFTNYYNAYIHMYAQVAKQTQSTQGIGEKREQKKSRF